MRKKRTLKRYADLFRDPSALFGPNTETVLFPNGENEIWLKDDRGFGVRITASRGDAGFGVTVQKFVGGTPLTLNGNTAKDWEPYAGPDMQEVTITQYLGDERSQQFKRWYRDEINPATGERWAFPDAAHPLHDSIVAGPQ